MFKRNNFKSLGLGISYAPQRKLFIGGIVGGAVGALGGLFGGMSKNKMIKQQIAALEKKKKENEDWYNRRYNEDPTQRADAQRLLTMQAERMKRANRAAAGTAAVMGGTDESVALQKEAGNKAMADTVSQIAVAGEARKDAIENQYQAKNDAYDEKIQNLEMQKQGFGDIASSMIGGAASGVSAGMGISGLLGGKKE